MKILGTIISHGNGRVKDGDTGLALSREGVREILARSRPLGNGSEEGAGKSGVNRADLAGKREARPSAVRSKAN